MKQAEENTLPPCIGLDLLGSDADSNFVLESALPEMEKLRHEARFLLFVEKKNIPALERHPFLSYQIAPEAILMDDDPLVSIRKKKNSSLLMGLRALKEHRLDAFISMGNTGALITASKTLLGAIPGVKRPALVVLLPSKKGLVAMLDVGASAECKSSYLEGFAIMGVAYQKTMGLAKPTLGLLNIGREAFKGTAELRNTYQTLSTLNDRYDYPIFCGNVEGPDIFEGQIDVIVTDGFTGNIFLKTAEGVSRFLLEYIKKTSNSPSPLLTDLQTQLDASEYSGAIVCGVDGLVIKCHGSAHPKIFQYNLTHALSLVKQNFLQKMKREISLFFS